MSPAVILLAAAGSWAGGSYYVDKTNGQDANPGTLSQPWEHCPGMGGWTGTQTLKPGDTVYFDSGDTWTASSGAPLLVVAGGVTPADPILSQYGACPTGM